MVNEVYILTLIILIIKKCGTAQNMRCHSCEKESNRTAQLIHTSKQFRFMISNFAFFSMTRRMYCTAILT